MARYLGGYGLVQGVCGLRCPGESALRLLGEAFKGTGIVYRQVGQDLAVQLHAALLQAVNQLAVAQAVELGSSADADDPQRPVLTLFLTATGVSELQPALHRLFGRTIKLGFG